jgi:hypothetical protein
MGGRVTFVDGNEMAGALEELFAVDVTMARWRCANCGREAEVAQARVYNRAPGQVARCPGCEEVLMRYVRGPDRAWLDLRGVTMLEFPMP